MYADTGVLPPHFQNFNTVQQIEDFWKTQKPNASSTNAAQTSTICDYDMGGEGDLFEAPKPIVEEPIPLVDPMTAAMSMISSGEDVMMSSQGLKVSDFETLQNDPLLSDVFYACKKDLLEKAAMETMPSETQTPELKSFSDDPFQKSISSGSLTTMEQMNRGAATPGFVDLHGIDMSSVCGMRRAFSEGDIKALCNDQITLIHSSLDRPLIPTIEERKEKLLRYRNKRSKRNFGRKIKESAGRQSAEDPREVCKDGRTVRKKVRMKQIFEFKAVEERQIYEALDSKWRQILVRRR